MTGASGGPTPETQQWIDRQKAVRAAVDADLALANAARAERKRLGEREYRNPATFWFGLIVLAVLFCVAWYVIEAMSCDRLFADLTRAHRLACQKALDPLAEP